MITETAQIVLIGLEALLKHSPEIYADIVQIFTKENVSVDDLRAFRKTFDSKRYKDTVKDTAIPPEEQT